MLTLLLVGTQIGPTVYTTLEVLMYSSSQVHLGQVTKVSRDTSHPSGKARLRILVGVSESFVGPSQKSFEIITTQLNHGITAEQSFQPTIKSLWLKHRESGEWQWFALAIPPTAPKESRRTGTFLPVFSMDYTILRTGDEAIKAARRFARELRAEPRAEIIRTSLPASLATQIKPFGDGIIFETLLHTQKSHAISSIIRSTF